MKPGKSHMNVKAAVFALCLLTTFLTNKVLFANSFANDSLLARYDTITIASEPDYPPHCFINEKGEADGLAVELFKAAAKEAGLTVNVHIGVWNVIKQELAEGRIDALPMVAKTPERESLYDFSIPFLSLEGAVFVRKGTSDIHSLDDLSGKEILVMKGDNAEEFVRREKLSDKIYTTHTYEEAFQQLATGNFDAVITQRLTGEKLLDELNIKSVAPLNFRIPDFSLDFCFAVKKGNEVLLQQLNEGLSVIIANDDFQKIKAKWLGPSVVHRLSPMEIAKVGVLIFVPLAILMSILTILFLRKEVKKRTLSLNEEIKEHKLTLEKYIAQQQQLKDSEQQTRLLLNSTAEGIFGLDNQGICTFINASGLRVLAYPEKTDLVGSKILDLIQSGKNTGNSIGDYNAFSFSKNGDIPAARETVLRRSDGSEFPAEFFSYPIIDKGDVVGTVVTFLDISERKKTERELLALRTDLQKQVQDRTIELEEKVQKLNRSQKAMLYMVEDLNKITSELKKERKKLEISNNELDAFAYSVSHDLRAPMRAINGFSGFLIEDYSDALEGEGVRYLNVIRENASRMDTLISDMLQLSRITRAELRLSAVDMTGLVNAVFDELATKKEKEKFEFCVHQMPSSDCDRVYIKQVWQNLLQNALKYSSKSEIKKIEVGASENQEEIIYYVKDWGAGFNPKYQHNLFSAFKRLHTEEEYEGTGVGLAIVKRIIRRHGGRVWAESEIDKGATFYFALPAKN